MKEFLSGLLRMAGKTILREFYRSTVPYSARTPQSLLTDADLVANDVLIKRIGEEFPEEPVLSEEDHKQSMPGNDWTGWIIDPLDGTSQFVMGLPVFAVMAARVLKGAITHAGVYLPVTQDIYYAQQGQGAWWNDTPLKINGVLPQPPIVVIAGRGKKQGLPAFSSLQSALFDLEYKIKYIGAHGPEACLLARSRIHGVINPGSYSWDNAAPALIITEAGGFCVSPGKDTFAIFDRGMIAAVSKNFLEQLQDIYRRSTRMI
ncbi:MAG: inositol monophosphatase [Candidatus Omnitrophica bacterium]|nr:inositol monophosphatase [Candidatus Omnitrophota bacterium]